MPKKKILIAEDDGFISEVYSTKLALEGFEVVKAIDGLAAMEQLRKERFDALLLDIMMPRMDGIEVLEEINSEPQLKGLLVLVLTNAGERENVEKAKKLGARDYLIKSNFTPEEVVGKIKKLFEEK